MLSVPYELRLTLARRADAFGALIRIFAGEVLRFLERASGVRAAKAGGVSFPQRFGGSLNLNTHVHAVFPDGVFVRDQAGRADFIRGRAPDSGDLVAICSRVHERFVRWLRKRGLLRSDAHDAHASNDLPARSCIDSCTEAALGIGTLARVKDANAERSDREAASPNVERPRGKKGKHVGEALGFGIHAGVTVPAGNTLGRELLLRYCARAPLSRERLSVLPDGRVAYRLKAPWRKDQTHRVMTPVELIARLAALVPPPRHPLIHFHGVFAPHCAWRASVVPESGKPSRLCDAQGTKPAPVAKASPAPATNGARASDPAALSAAGTTGEQAGIAGSTEPSAERRARKSWWIDWATLLRRVYDVDALQCPCGGRLSFVAVVTDRAAGATILRELGLPADPPTISRSRDPTPDFDPPPPDAHVDEAPTDDFDQAPPPSW
ncbi:MAG: transposase [Myxococcales bacterium]|nr:transposase [Myxococcales bacterium]